MARTTFHCVLLYICTYIYLYEHTPTYVHVYIRRYKKVYLFKNLLNFYSYHCFYSCRLKTEMKNKLPLPQSIKSWHPELFSRLLIASSFRHNISISNNVLALGYTLAKECCESPLTVKGFSGKRKNSTNFQSGTPCGTNRTDYHHNSTYWRYMSKLGDSTEGREACLAWQETELNPCHNDYKTARWWGYGEPQHHRA